MSKATWNAFFRTTAFSIFFICLFISPLESQVIPGQYSGYTIDGKTVIVRADTISVRILFLTSDIVRVDFLPNLTAVPESSFVVIRDTSSALHAAVAENDSALDVSSPSLTVHFRKQPLRFGFRTTAGKLLVSEPADGGLQAAGDDRTVKFVLNPDDHFYGTGERGISLDKRGTAFDSRNEPHYGYTSPLPTMNLNVPFVATSGGYALYFDNTYPGRFDFGVLDPSAISYTAHGGELTYYFIADPTVSGQLERYTWLTGRQPLPPRWALGYIQSKFGYRNETEARGMARTMRTKNIPCDAIILDLYWFQQMGDLQWNTTAFPQPATMMSDLRAEGFKTILITEPYLTQGSINYTTASNSGFVAHYQGGEPYILNGWWSCGCPAVLADFSNPAVRSWWWSLHPSFLGSEVAGFWTDLGEPERDANDMVFHLGSAERIHNIYNFLWAQTLDSGFRAFRPDERIFNLTRSGFAGMQRFGTIPWSGDVGKSFDGLAVQIPMMLGMGMSGFAYHNSDIGGFTGMGTGELYTRWMQYGAFCPVMRAHGTGQPTEPWGYGSTVESATRKIIELRYRLLPYNYSLAYKNYRSGTPLARPLFFNDPANPGLANETGAYYWGDAFLVSPIVRTSQFTTTVNLPGGTWIDFWTDSVYSGNMPATVASPLDRVPLFIRQGSIIPMQEVMNYSDEHLLDTLFLHVYPDQYTPSEDTLYEDDGKTLAYQSGGYSLTLFRSTLMASGDSSTPALRLALDIGASSGSYTGKIPSRSYLSVIHLIGHTPALVTVNGSTVPGWNSIDDLRHNGNGYYYDDSSRTLTIQSVGSTDSSFSIIADIPSGSTGTGENVKTHGFRLDEAYPNPFNPTTTIAFYLPTTEKVTLRIVDLLGRSLATLIGEEIRAGEHRVTFDARNFPGGIYFCTFQSPHFSTYRKLILLK